MNPLVAKLEEKLLPEFQKIAKRLNQTIPNISTNVESHNVGSLTEYQGHSFGISCLFTADILYDADEVTDNVALIVTVFHLTRKPKINAYVCWGHPSGYLEAEFPDYAEDTPNNSLIVSDQTLEDLYNELPRLYEALLKALKRRKPSNE
jgi:hypothetical protein